MSKGTSSIQSLDTTSSMMQSTSSTLGISSSNSYNTMDLQKLSLSTSSHPIEQADWVVVNEKLRSHGLHPISLTHPSKCQQSKDFVLLDEGTSEVLRKTILHLLQETDRRQALFEELLTTSNKMQKDKNHLQKTIDHLYQKKLQTIQNEERTKDTQEYQMHGKTLEDGCNKRISKLQVEINELRSSFENLKKEKGDHTDHIDIKELLPGDGCVNTDAIKHVPKKPFTPEVNTARSNFTEFDDLGMKLYKYKKKYINLKKENETLRSENTNLLCLVNQMKLKEHSSPLSSDYEQLQKKVTNQQKILDQNNLNYLLLEDHCPVFSTSIHHLDKLPITECQKYLQAFCRLLHVEDVREALSTIKSLDKQKSYFTELEKLHEKLHGIMTRKQTSSIELLESRMELLSTADEWRNDRNQLKDVFKAIKDLSMLIIPWASSQDLPGQSSPATVGSIKDLVKHITATFYRGTYQTSARDSTPSSPEENLKIVEHFMRLFDVRQYDAVYTRMHDVYVKYFELVNVFHSIQEILHVGGSLNNLVDAIGQLAKAKHLLHVHHLESVIKRLEKYDEFYEAFHGMTTELLHVLCLDNLDEIVPTVKSLLRYSSPS